MVRRYPPRIDAMPEDIASVFMRTPLREGREALELRLR